MIVWLLLIGYIVFIRLLMGSLSTDKAKKNFLICVGIATFLVIGLRGGDYANVYDLRVYRSFYELMMHTPWSDIFDVSEFEPGYAVLNKVLSTIFPFSQAIILFEAGFCVFSVCYFIYHNTDNVFWAFYFYVTLGSMGFMLTGFRQAIAMCVCLFGVELIKKRKLIPYLIVVILAFTIHRSAMVFIPLYFIARSKTIIKKRWTIVLVVAFMIVFAPAILDFGKLISQGELVASSEAVYSLNGIVHILIYIISLFGQIIIDDRDKERKLNYYILSPMLAIGLGFYLMRFYNMAIERLAWYYTQASYICLSNFFGIFEKNQSLKLLKSAAILLAFILFFKRVQTADYGMYTFFWN